MTVIRTLAYLPIFQQLGNSVPVVPGQVYVTANIPAAARMVYLQFDDANSVGRVYGGSGVTKLAELGFVSFAQGNSLILPQMQVLSRGSLMVVPDYYDFPFHLVFSSRCFGVMSCYDVGVRQKFWNVSDPQNLPQLPASVLIP